MDFVQSVFLMHCYEPPRYTESDADQLAKSNAQFEALLCACMRVIASHRLESEIDFNTAGVSSTVLTEWWKEHLKKDARKSRERQLRRAWHLGLESITKDLEVCTAEFSSEFPGDQGAVHMFNTARTTAISSTSSIQRYIDAYIANLECV